MKIIIGADEAIAAYIAEATGDALHQPLRTIAVHGRNGLIGGIAVDRYTGFGANISGAGKGIVLREVRQVLCDLVFGYLGCRRMEITVRKSNWRMRKLAPRLGFAFEGKLRKFFGSEDGMCYSLLSEEAIELGHWMPLKKVA